MSKLRLAVLDCQTSGAPNTGMRLGPEILEVGAVLVDLSWPDCPSLTRPEMQVAAARASASLPGPCFETLVHPVFWVHRSREAVEDTGLSYPLLRDAPPAQSAGAHLRHWLAQHEVQGLTSWNTFFDFHPELLLHRKWLGNPEALGALNLHPMQAPCLKLTALYVLSTPWREQHSLSLSEARAALLPDPSALALHRALSCAQAAAELLTGAFLCTFVDRLLWQLGDAAKLNQVRFPVVTRDAARSRLSSEYHEYSHEHLGPVATPEH